MRLHELPTEVEEGIYRVVVESPRGSSVKLKYDAETGVFTVSRELPLGLSYPFDWGFVAGTKGPDGDPIDAMILGDAATATGVVVPCRLIGLLELEQNAEGGERQRNDRVLAVSSSAARFDGLDDVRSLPDRFRDELTKFFLDVTHFTEKNAAPLGWRSPEAARALVRR